jgi:hypothetical protein
MYINQIEIERFRTFRKATVQFVHPDQDFEQLGFPQKPRLPNVNLLLGNNGSGKTSLLKTVAIAALGPAIQAASLPVYRLIRREPGDSETDPSIAATIRAEFVAHDQELRAMPEIKTKRLESAITIRRMGDLELPEWTHSEQKSWHPIFSTSSDAFFFVGYGATRRVESTDRVDPGARQANSFVRAQRIRSLFEEAYSLIPLPAWLPQLQSENPGRFTQVKHLIDRLLDGTGYSFTEEREGGEYLFERNQLKVPFPALSDGYRAYLGWISDLLYHVTSTCPPGEKLVENKGIVMVDEIDLHLHPRWQMTVLPTLARALPGVQFIVTSHSPLVVGSLEWMNILLMQPSTRQAFGIQRVEEAVHGLDADQVLLSDFFGLESTRQPGKKRALKELSVAASAGDTEAALRLAEEMSRGAERVG